MDYNWLKARVKRAFYLPDVEKTAGF